MQPAIRIKFLQKAFKTISDEGLFIFLRKAIKLMAFNIFRVRRVIIYELALENHEGKILPEIEISFRPARRADIESMSVELFGYNHKATQYSLERLDQGDECILAVHNGLIAGYVWIMKDSMELSQFRHIRVPKDKAYIYNGFVLKEFRGKRILNALDGYVIEKLKREGKKFLIATVAHDNKPPIKAQERIGFKKVGEIIGLKALGYQYSYIPKKSLDYITKE